MARRSALKNCLTLLITYNEYLFFAKVLDNYIMNMLRLLDHLTFQLTYINKYKCDNNLIEKGLR